MSLANISIKGLRKPIQGDPCKPDYFVARAAGRVHVGERYTDALRSLVSRHRRSWKRWSRDQRRLAVGMVVWQHNENRALYRAVVTGTFS